MDDIASFSLHNFKNKGWKIKQKSWNLRTERLELKIERLRLKTETMEFKSREVGTKNRKVGTLNHDYEAMYFLEIFAFFMSELNAKTKRNGREKKKFREKCDSFVKRFFFFARNPTCKG